MKKATTTAKTKDRPMKKAATKARVLTTDELQLLFNKPYPYGPMFELTYLTGSRMSEIRELRGEAIRRDGLYVPQSKVSREKKITITPRVKAALDKLPANAGYLFPSPAVQPNGSKGNDKQPISRAMVAKKLSSYIKEHDLTGASTHSFRRSLATHLYKAGEQPVTIMQITGHTTIANLLEYIDVSAEEAGEAVSRVLDKLFGDLG